MAIKTSVVFLIILCMQGDPAADAVAELNQAFRNHHFDPNIINAPFDRRELDPLIVELEWNGVRGHVEHALNRLNVGIRPISLPCEFRPLPAADDCEGETPLHLIPVFVFEKGNDRAKQVLKQVLGLRDDALWDYEPATGIVTSDRVATGVILAKIGNFRPKYIIENKTIDLVQVHIGLQEIINDDDNLLKRYHFRPIAPHIVKEKGLIFATVWKTVRRSELIAHGWRIKFIIEKNKFDAASWDITSKIEIGRRYASQVDYTVVEDSENGELRSLTSSLRMREGNEAEAVFRQDSKAQIVRVPRKIEGEVVKAEVPPPIDRVRAEGSSPMANLATALDEICRKKLLVEPE